MTAAHSLRTAVLTASVLLALTGCAAGSADPENAPLPSSPSTSTNADADSDTGSDAEGSGTMPSGTADPDVFPDIETDPDGANAASAASVLAQKSREWLTAWDAAGCTGESAAEDVRECQIMLMDLADTAGGVADLLEQEAPALDGLVGAAEAARDTAVAADDWLGAWCGAYADPACAEPGIALVDAQRALDSALDPWLPRATPDA